MKRKKLNTIYKKITSIRFIEQLGFLTGISPHIMVLQSVLPKYDMFYVRKRTGGKRLIENPNPILKNIQRKLNKYLQVVYYIHCPQPSHGFVINVKRGKKKGIISNAKVHIGNDYMLNIDLKDFFYYIKYNTVYKIFNSDLFNFNTYLVKILADLCCKDERLPMGAPTSPVLANLACIDMDLKLESICNSFAIKYTRYADDMTFSGLNPIPDHLIKKIYSIIDEYGFVVNEKKVKLRGINDQKKVTGIIVGDGLSLAEFFFEETLIEISKLKTLMELNYRYRGNKDKLVNKHKQKIDGYINYATQIYGKDNEKVQQLIDELDKAMSIEDFIEPMSWDDFPYV
ncbi:MAG TPA: RNA-directed DNA polymerase [Bacteroidetes bacterium]|nr:RNA-directed DNA polymerase [Bacteroidota bacterium]